MKAAVPTSASPKKSRTSSSSPSSSSSSSAAAAAAHAPHAPHFEFGGPLLGPLGILVGLPLLVLLFSCLCGEGRAWPDAQLLKELNSGGGLAAGVAAAARYAAAEVRKAASLEVLLAYVAYFLLHALLALVVPGEEREGAPLVPASGRGARLRYKLNGLRCLCIVVALFVFVQLRAPFGRYVPAGGVAHRLEQQQPALYGLEWLLDNWAALSVATTAFSFALSAFLYAFSFAPAGEGAGPKVLAEGGDTGHALYDFFIGRELNPRVAFGQLDLKFFCELRPGLCMWMLVNLGAAFRQANLNGGRVDAWMVAVLALEGFYIVDSVWNESAILTTMDITTDGFGFMLAFGDLAWVPAVYSLQARFLADQFSPLAGAADYAKLALVLSLAAAGMYVFRESNSQKDAFKSNPAAPEFKGMRIIKTPTGSSLIAGGWWGVARHVNYLGECGAAPRRAARARAPERARECVRERSLVRVRARARVCANAVFARLRRPLPL